MPESFFVLSKENLELAKEEVISIAKGYDRFAKARTISNLVIIQSKIPWQIIAKRAAYVKIAGQILRKLSGLFLDEESFSLLLNAKTFSCRVINLTSEKSNVSDLEKTLGNMISKFSNAKVSLNDPEIIIYLIFTEVESFFGFSTKFHKYSSPRKVKKYPHELNSKLCRAMINLSGLKEGNTICDPFCGTGTTLLEAEAMGIHSIGIDFDERMYHITKQNLTSNGFNSKIIIGDYTKLLQIKDKIDGVITDLPYGKNSKLSDTLDRIVENFVSIIPKRKKFVIMCKKGFEKKLKIIPSKKFDIYRHKSLTRTILVK